MIGSDQWGGVTIKFGQALVPNYVSGMLVQKKSFLLLYQAQKIDLYNNNNTN